MLPAVPVPVAPCTGGTPGWGSGAARACTGWWWSTTSASQEQLKSCRSARTPVTQHVLMLYVSLLRLCYCMNFHHSLTSDRTTPRSHTHL